MPAETTLIKKIKEHVKEKGGKVIKIHQSGFSELGVPDLIIILPKKPMFFLEVKSKGKKPAKIQVAKINEINKAGGLAFWTDSYEGFTNIIEMLCRNSR
jgi:Holliday junction resolvase